MEKIAFVSSFEIIYDPNFNLFDLKSIEYTINNKIDLT